MPETYEGVLKDLIAKHDLLERNVQITVVDQPPRTEIPRVPNQLEKLKAWAEKHKFTGPPVDDSRDSIYSGTIDDTR